MSESEMGAYIGWMAGMIVAMLLGMRYMDSMDDKPKPPKPPTKEK
jgi:hypothetical protein